MKKFCTACGNVGHSVLVLKGSVATEFLLWITFLLPGIIYSIWRANSKHEACSACGSPQVIPVDSPMARKLMGDDYQKMKEEEAQAAAEAQKAAEEALRRIREEEARRQAQPWLRRNAGVLVLMLGVLGVGGGLVSAMFLADRANHTNPADPAATVQRVIPSVPVVKAHRKKPPDLCQVEAGGKLVPCKTIKREAQAASWHTQPYCEANGFVWHDEGCFTK